MISASKEVSQSTSISDSYEAAGRRQLVSLSPGSCHQAGPETLLSHEATSKRDKPYLTLLSGETGPVCTSPGHRRAVSPGEPLQCPLPCWPQEPNCQYQAQGLLTYSRRVTATGLLTTPSDWDQPCCKEEALHHPRFLQAPPTSPAESSGVVPHRVGVPRSPRWALPSTCCPSVLRRVDR